MAPLPMIQELPVAETLSPPSLAAAALSRDERVLAHLCARCAGALAALAASLEGIELVLERLGDAPGNIKGREEARALVTEVTAMLRRDGPPLLLRVQALRMHLHLAGFIGPDSLGAALAALQGEIARLAELELPEDRSDMTGWFLPLRQGRAHAMRLAAEFVSHARRLSGSP
ncbi:MAG: hypothetical protein N3D18_09670 [Roseococcus sp.]|nr:hypothetical protein [Roseococcus sp.]